MDEYLIDRIAQFSGSRRFLYINVALFAFWIGVNVTRIWNFDAYPFSFLTLVVSLEAIVLTILVLISQNRQAAADRAMEQRDCQINEKAEKEIRLLMEHMNKHSESLELQSELLQAVHTLLSAKPVARVRRKNDEVTQ